MPALELSLADRIRGAVDMFWRELAKFGIVGVIAFVIDFGGFNLLFYGPLQGHLTTAKIISGVAATTFAWVGNRLWTFRHRRNRPVYHEALLFFVVNAIGLAIATLWLNFTHDALGMDSRTAVSLNTVLGIALATMFRFWAYRQFVFAGEHLGDPEPALETTSHDTPMSGTAAEQPGAGEPQAGSRPAPKAASGAERPSASAPTEAA